MKNTEPELKSKLQFSYLAQSGSSLAVEHRHGHEGVPLLRVEVLHEQHGELDVVGVVLEGHPDMTSTLL